MAQLVKQQSIQHVAIIMDGNRRWAKIHERPATAGHEAGVESLQRVVRYCKDVGIGILTVYAFSTENWSRTATEVGFLMKLFAQAVSAQLPELNAQGVRLRFIGDLRALPLPLQGVLRLAEHTTEKNDQLLLQVATNYGSRAELVQAARQIAQAVKAGQLQPNEIDEDTIDQYLYTQQQPAPDLLIRSGGEQRLSNFLLWQCAYTELYVTPVLWPDFGAAELEQALLTFAARQRRYGT